MTDPVGSGVAGRHPLLDQSSREGIPIERRDPPTSPPGEPARTPAPADVPVPPRAEGPNAARTGSRPLIIVAGFVSLFAALLVLGAIAEDVHEQEANALDAIATPLLHSLAGPALDAVMRAFTDLGSTTVLVPLFAVVFVVLVWKHHRREAVLLTVAVAGSVLLNQSMKLIFQRPRPQLDWATVQPEYSFPSGHSMDSLVFYVALALLVWRLVGQRAGLIAIVVAVVMALLVGTSRIYLGYHYFTDVVGGFLAGAVWLFVVFAAFDHEFRRRLQRAKASAT
jgi:undecaprenyl-diphosphatase